MVLRIRFKVRTDLTNDAAAMPAAASEWALMSRCRSMRAGTVVRAQDARSPEDPMTRAEFVVFVRAAKLGGVATVDAEGHPEAALVDLAVTDHGEVLFDTMAGAHKVV
jgi:hypothetical protein